MPALLSSLSSRARRGLALGVLAGSGLLVAAACSSGTSAPNTAGAATPTTAVAAQPAPHAPVWAAVGQSQLGPIVVDSSGRTLYRFDKDTPGNGMSACNGACAAAWPAALVTAQPAAGAGLTGAVGSITRADGSHQLTLDGHPLYRYVGDQGPGDTTGDGFGGIWHVVHTTSSAAGAPSVSAPRASAPPASAPPTSKLPASTPAANKPPAATLPPRTPPASTPPASTPPMTTPQATGGPWPGY